MINILLKFNFINVLEKLFFLIILFLIFLKLHLKKREVKVCVCTCGKNENKYALEFVEHYIKYGVDTIFIYDNNDINDERFEHILGEYIKAGFVKIVNIRGKLKYQMPAFNDCYKNNKNIYDYFIFFDMDEFIFLKDYPNIKQYLSQETFNKCNIIYFNHIMHTDNNNIFYENKSLKERFPEIETTSRANHSSVYIRVLKDVIKSILKGNLENIVFKNPHTLNPNISKGCNGFGQLINQKSSISLITPDYKYYYYDHYYFKSAEEFIIKLTKGDVFYGRRNRLELLRFFLYFAFNKITEKKLNYFENKSGLKLDIFRNTPWNILYP